MTKRKGVPVVGIGADELTPPAAADAREPVVDAVQLLSRRRARRLYAGPFRGRSDDAVRSASLCVAGDCEPFTPQELQAAFTAPPHTIRATDLWLLRASVTALMLPFNPAGVTIDVFDGRTAFQLTLRQRNGSWLVAGRRSRCGLDELDPVLLPDGGVMLSLHGAPAPSVGAPDGAPAARPSGSALRAAFDQRIFELRPDLSIRVSGSVDGRGSRLVAGSAAFLPERRLWLSLSGGTWADVHVGLRPRVPSGPGWSSAELLLVDSDAVVGRIGDATQLFAPLGLPSAPGGAAVSAVVRFPSDLAVDALGRPDPAAFSVAAERWVAEMAAKITPAQRRVAEAALLTCTQSQPVPLRSQGRPRPALVA